MYYVGLQTGEQGGQSCWGGSSFGKYGKVDETKCSVICNQDVDVKCGNVWLNNIYDI